MTVRRPSVSLFSNCGAGDIGYARAGFEFVAMAELDPRRLEVAGLNHRKADLVPGDLRETWPTVVDVYRTRMGERRPYLLAACPPCQGMSSAQSGRGRGEDPDAGSRDARNLLVVVIANVALELLPKAIVVENVPQFLTRKVRDPATQRPVSAASLLVSLLEQEYVCFPMMADLADFGIPQTRKRAFLTFIHRGEAGLQTAVERRYVPYPRPTHGDAPGADPHVSVMDAFRDAGLLPLDSNASDTACPDETPEFHMVPVWPARIYSMVDSIPPGSGASAWETSECRECGSLTDNPDAASCLACQCPLPRPVVEEPDGNVRLVRGFRSSSYRRMAPDLPASTVTTGSGHVGSDRTIHPFENRILSPLECMILQTFPSDFAWGDALEKWGHTNVRDMIGEAVPPEFTYRHGLAVRGVLEGRWRVAPLGGFDPRSEKAHIKLKLPYPPEIAAS